MPLPCRLGALPALAVAFAVALLAAPQVSASGYHVLEQGAKASSEAGAFIARADDASAMYFNPAGIAFLDRPQALGGFSGVFVGRISFTPDPAARQAVPPPYDARFNGEETSLKSHVGTPVHFYYAHPLAGTPFALGLAVTTPFGLKTDWTDPSADTRFVSWLTELRTYVYSFNGAARLGGGWAASVGLDCTKADLRDYSRRVVVPVAGVGAYEYLLNASAKGTEWSYNGGLMWKGAGGWSFGAVYRSKSDVQADGKVNITPAVAVPGPIADRIALLLPSGPAHGTIKLPATYGVGVAYAGRRWEAEFDLRRIAWGHFDSIPLDFENNTPALPDEPIPEDWSDATSYRLGGAYNLGDRHQLRAGIYYETSPVPLSTLRPSIPDSDRIGISIGYGGKFGKFTLDAYYLYVTGKDTTVGAADMNPAGSLLEETSRVGAYRTRVDLLGMSLGYRF